MGGKLAVAFAFLLKVLWSGKHHSYAPAKLKVSGLSEKHMIINLKTEMGSAAQINVQRCHLSNFPNLQT